MKKQYFLSLIILCLLCSRSGAQAPFNTIDSVDINNIHAPILVHGDMWWNPEVYTTSHWPDQTEKGCTLYGNPYKPINFAGSVWMSGYDAGNQLHIAAQTYRQSGNDYWPGPPNTAGTLDHITSQKWAKIWKVNGTDVQYFNSLSTHTTANTPQAILTWPAKGNAYAQGNGGAPLIITEQMAPFIDLNSNGIYEPLQGEYPDFIGDQVLWWVFSDNGPTHSETQGSPLGVEIHAMAYAYNRGTLIDNVIYYDYTIINKSANNYHDFRFAIWNDVNMGYYLNDFTGFDSSRRLGICYDGSVDDGGSGGHPVNSFGVSSPVTGITMISLPGDVATDYVPAGSFICYHNDVSIIGNPANDTECNNYMRAKLRNGQHFVNDFAGAGIASRGYGSGPACNYLFTGDPADRTQWSECTCNNNPGDRRSILSSNDFNLGAGSTQHIVIAQVTTDTGEGACPRVNFNGIKRVTDTAWNNYYNPPSPLHRPALTGAVNISIYPNPVYDLLNVEDKLHNMDDVTITIYNYLGKAIEVPAVRNGQKYELNTRQLPPGFYNARYRNGSIQTNIRFTKE